MKAQPIPASQPSAWPGPPAMWSPSSLRDVEACPRRWALRRATYETFGEGGFPRRPSTPALAGTVVHAVVERVLEALGAAGCAATHDPQVVTVLRKLGGLSALVEAATTEALADARRSPRFASIAERVEADLARRDLRGEVQLTLSVAPLVPPPRTRTAQTRGGGTSRRAVEASRPPLPDGAHSEVRLVADDLRLMGFADLIIRHGSTVDIIDMKTGGPSPDHHDQVRIYGLLWLDAADRNPEGITPTSLALQYGAERVAIEPPSDWDAWRERLRQRINEADQAVSEHPPVACPHPDLCPGCDVRAVCDAYWTARPADHSRSASSFVDLGVSVVHESEPGVWTVEVAAAPSVSRGPARLKAGPWMIEAGEQLVALGARHIEADEGVEEAPPLYVLSSWSEVFKISGLSTMW